MQKFLNDYFIFVIAVLSILILGSIMVYSAIEDSKFRIACEAKGGYYYRAYRAETLCIQKPIELNLKENTIETD